ncbi:uncharacterized protein [Rutidosis leptorrhynchoides]|uniref:uncharacterized protein n=1 Tax=Rutidosis leptorrhynchoides TaxID=125765 RepID=UPI003A99A100
MISFASWNIRGLNLTPKHNEVIDVVNSNHLCVCTVLESHVASPNLNRIGNSIFPSWSWASNASVCMAGTRILVGWDPGIVNLLIIALSELAIHCQIVAVNGNYSVSVSFVYAANKYIDRRPLWRDLNMHKVFVGSRPWVVMGDFNAFLSMVESSAGSANTTIAMREFKECVDSLCLSDVNHTGFQFTLNQRAQSNDGILKKIDRVMANDVFIEQFTNAVAIFQPYRISDHTPDVLQIPFDVGRRQTPFRFSNYLTNHTLFMDTVIEGWKMDVNGHAMFKFVKKLCSLKKPMYANPDSPSARENATNTLKEFNDAILDEESFLKQKAKIEWLHVGDNNLSYFHKLFEMGRSRKGGQSPGESDVHGPGQDVINVVQEFFLTGQMLKEINYTIVSLIPKVYVPSKVTDYRPIACCNVIYKCISKIIVARIKSSLDDIVNINQSAFIPGRKIADNILLTQELMRNYHLNKVIRDSLEEFKKCSGLVPSLPKSPAFFANVSNVMKQHILWILPFEEGKLPIRYIGVPLVSSRLMYRDCKVLVERGEMKRGKAKVKWDDLCKPKDEGGLGIKRLKYWNIALMTSHIWRILTNKQTLWVKWIHTYHLANHHFWEVPITATASWSWRKLMRIRPIIEVVRDSNWTWPTSWAVSYPQLRQISVPELTVHPDEVLWSSYNNVKCRFSVARVWEAIRPRLTAVAWFRIVWFSQCIPRHAFLVWLLMGERLKTQDKLKSWEIHNMQLICPLCRLYPDSHDHLFFECLLARKIWKRMVVSTWLTALENWKSICNCMQSSANRNTSSMVVAKLVFGATVYFIWQERNNRLFKKSHRTEVKLLDDIFCTVRLKLMSIKFKDSAKVERMKMTLQI